MHNGRLSQAFTVMCKGNATAGECAGHMRCACSSCYHVSGASHGPSSPSLYPSLAYLVLPSLAATVSECQLVWQRLDLMLVGRVKRKMMQITRRRNTFPSFAVQNVKMESLLLQSCWRGRGHEGHEGGWTTVFVVCCKKLFKLFGQPKLDSRKLKARDFLIVLFGLRTDKLMLLLPAKAWNYISIYLCYICLCLCVCLLCISIWQPSLRIGLADVGRFLAVLPLPLSLSAPLPSPALAPFPLPWGQSAFFQSFFRHIDKLGTIQFFGFTCGFLVLSPRCFCCAHLKAGWQLYRGC